MRAMFTLVNFIVVKTCRDNITINMGIFTTLQRANEWTKRHPISELDKKHLDAEYHIEEFEVDPT